MHLTVQLGSAKSMSQTRKCAEKHQGRRVHEASHMSQHIAIQDDHDGDEDEMGVWALIFFKIPLLLLSCNIVNYKIPVALHDSIRHVVT